MYWKREETYLSQRRKERREKQRRWNLDDADKITIKVIGAGCSYLFSIACPLWHASNAAPYPSAAEMISKDHFGV